MKVITAIGNPEINEELRKDDFYKVVGVDIQYQDGIFEILEENKNIDYLILNFKLIDELNKFDFFENNIIKNKKEINLINENNNFNKKNPFNFIGEEKINLNNKKILLFGNKKINKKNIIILFLKLINKKILIIEFINISKKINPEEKENTIKINKKIDLIKCNIESLNRKDLKNKFGEYYFIIFNFFNIKEKNKIIEIINLIF